MRNLDMMELANEAFGVGPSKFMKATPVCPTPRGTKECGTYDCQSGFGCRGGFTCQTKFDCTGSFTCVNEHSCKQIFTDPS